MKKSLFVGRHDEMKRLENLKRKSSSSLVVIHGRRRIGKSRLVEEFGKTGRFLRFSGLPPTSGTRGEDQRITFAKQLSKELHLPSFQSSDWSDLFSFLAKETKTGKVIILLDEISWMGSKDPLFLGKLKNAWDMEFKQNPELILILCGSVSSWIEKNILNSTGFMGRISLTLALEELSLKESYQLLKKMGFRGSPYDVFKLLSVTGGIPRYLEEIQPHLPAEANIHEMCFRPGGILFREFDDIFTDLFSSKSETYKKLARLLVKGSYDIPKLAKDLQLSQGGHISDCTRDLMQLGFIQRDYTWNIKDGKESKLSRFRLRDNYIRFYLKYIEPNKSKIKSDKFEVQSFMSLSSWETIMGLQFENMVVGSRKLLWPHLPFPPSNIVNDNPFFQKATTRHKGCQIDYLIQTRFNDLFVCEVKFSSRPIKKQVIQEVEEKIKRLALPKRFSTWPVLIHVNGVEDSVIESEYFSMIIDFSSLID